MDIDQETYQILAQRLIGTFDSKEYVDWALKLLTRGDVSESLLILAGMDNDSTEDRERYFWLSITELKLELSKSNYELIDSYAIKLAEQVINAQINPRIALARMIEIIKLSDYNQRYIQFYDIEEDIAYVSYEGTPLVNQGLTKENVDDFIIKEFQLFIDASKM